MVPRENINRFRRSAYLPSTPHNNSLTSYSKFVLWSFYTPDGKMIKQKLMIKQSKEKIVILA